MRFDSDEEGESLKDVKAGNAVKVCIYSEGLCVSLSLLKAVDSIGKYSKIIISIKPYLVTSNGELLIV